MENTLVLYQAEAWYLPGNGGTTNQAHEELNSPDMLEEEVASSYPLYLTLMLENPRDPHLRQMRPHEGPPVPLGVAWPATTPGKGST